MLTVISLFVNHNTHLQVVGASYIIESRERLTGIFEDRLATQLLSHIRDQFEVLKALTSDKEQMVKYLELHDRAYVGSNRAMVTIREAKMNVITEISKAIDSIKSELLSKLNSIKVIKCEKYKDCLHSLLNAN